MANTYSEYTPKRGDVVWAFTPSFDENGDVRMGKKRPCVVISNDKNNMFSGSLTLIPLTSQPKKELPTHVSIESGDVHGTALCEQVTQVTKSLVDKNYDTTLDETTMSEIEKAVMVQLGIEREPGSIVIGGSIPASENATKILLLEQERDIYKQLYTDLMSKAKIR